MISEQTSTYAERAVAALSEVQVAALIGIKCKTLQDWRLRGSGPPWIRVGKRLVRYPVSTLHEWLAAQPGGPR